jgi:hypothetical protein
VSDAARSHRAPRFVAALIVTAGVVAALLVVLLGRGSDATGDRAAVAAPPSFGSSLPITAPSAAASGAAGRDAQLRDPATVTAVLDAATSAIQIIDSYDYRTLVRNRAAGDGVSTGAFRDRYDASLRGAIATSAVKERTVQQAVVQKVAVTSLSPDGSAAGVLAFGRLLITDSANPGSTTSPLASGVTLRKVGGAWRISDMVDLADRGTFTADPPGNAALLAAVTAGAREVVDLLSYDRASFTADVNRALDGLTGALRSQQAQRAQSLASTMAAQHMDYAGAVRSVGVESASGSSVLLLVCATGYELVDGTRAPQSGTERFEVGVTRTGGRWLVSEYLALPAGG